MLLTSEKLLRRLSEHLNSSVRVDVASAWATEGHALHAMQEAAKRAWKPIGVRAIIGLRHHVTTPNALETLREIGELRLVGGDRLFHPKVYIFHKEEGRSVAWVGSANFTGKGIGHAEERVNEEIVFETQRVREVAGWFEQRWKKIKYLDEELLRNYVENYKQPKDDGLDERPEPGSRIIFMSHGKRNGRHFSGICCFVSSSGSKEELAYDTHQEALEIVLRKLSRDLQDERLLRKIEQDGFEIKGKPLLAANQNRVYRKPSQRRHTPKRLEPSRWWICNDTASQQKRKLIDSAAKLANVQVAWDKNSKYGF